MAGFQKASRKKSRLRMAIEGPSGSGKTMSALKVARSLVGPEGKIGVIDTERGSAELYEGHPEVGDFYTLQISGDYNPKRFIAAIREAEDAGFDALIIDSMSHAWSGTGGCLELVEKATPKYRGNSYAAWGEVTPLYEKLIEAILTSPMHTICTMRSKTEYSQEKDSRGKTVVREVGMEAVQRKDIRFEFAVIGSMDRDSHSMVITKSRCSTIDGKVFDLPGKNLGGELTKWLEQGDEVVFEKAEPEQEVKPEDSASDPKPTPKSEPTINDIFGLFGQYKKLVEASKGSEISSDESWSACLSLLKEGGISVPESAFKLQNGHRKEFIESNDIPEMHRILSEAV